MKRIILRVLFSNKYMSWIWHIEIILTRGHSLSSARQLEVTNQQDLVFDLLPHAQQI